MIMNTPVTMFDFVLYGDGSMGVSYFDMRIGTLLKEERGGKYQADDSLCEWLTENIKTLGGHPFHIDFDRTPLSMTIWTKIFTDYDNENSKDGN